MTASFTLFLVAVFIGAVWWGWEWPYIAKLMPVYIAAVPGLVLGVTQLIGEASGSEARRAKTTFSSAPRAISEPIASTRRVHSASGPSDRVKGERSGAGACG